MITKNLTEGSTVNSLDIGCGNRYSADVRVDLFRGSANVIASADKLPFIDGCFNKTICISVLEHVPHWHEALNEICRVTTKDITVEVPVNSNTLKTDIFRVLLPIPENIKLLVKMKERAKHNLWQFNPRVLVKVMGLHRFRAYHREVVQYYHGMPSRCWRINGAKPYPSLSCRGRKWIRASC